MTASLLWLDVLLESMGEAGVLNSTVAGGVKVVEYI